MKPQKSANRVSEWMAVISAVTALVAVFGTAFKVKTSDLWHSVTQRDVVVHYYNRAAQETFSGDYIGIQPEWTLENKSYTAPLVIYGGQCFHPGEIRFDKRQFTRELAGVTLNTPVKNWRAAFTRELLTHHYISAMNSSQDSFLPAFNPEKPAAFTTAITTDPADKQTLFSVLKGQYNPENVYHYSTQGVDEDGKSLRFPFILKPRGMCLLTLKTQTFPVNKANLAANPHIQLILNTQQADMTFRVTHNRKGMARRL